MPEIWRQVWFTENRQLNNPLSSKYRHFATLDCCKWTSISLPRNQDISKHEQGLSSLNYWGMRRLVEFLVKVYGLGKTACLIVKSILRTRFRAQWQKCPQFNSSSAEKALWPHNRGTNVPSYQPFPRWGPFQCILQDGSLGIFGRQSTFRLVHFCAGNCRTK